MLRQLTRTKSHSNISEAAYISSRSSSPRNKSSLKPSSSLCLGQQTHHLHSSLTSSIHSQTTMNDPKGAVVFSTVGRAHYGFDVFCLPVHSYTDGPEQRFTDGRSVNYNAQFANDGNQSVVFISERTGFPAIYLTRPGLPNPQLLHSEPGSLFHDRPILKNDILYFISAHQQPDRPFKSWSALYSTLIHQQNQNKITETTRLTPSDSADYSPAVSPSGKFVAVASYGSRPWDGEFHHLKTDIVVFHASEPSKRVFICERGGWPTWSGESVIYFHRQDDDGWWSIFRVDFPHLDSSSGHPITPTRVTPSGLHCFTPAALHDGKRIAVATRRRDKNFRHIELFDVESETFGPFTESVNPNFHHYNPFVSPDSKLIGYHRFRGESTQWGESTIPYLERVSSPIKQLHMVRIHGSFPTFSPDGDLIAFNTDFDANPGIKIVKSDGSKHWTLIKDRAAFYNAWSPTEKYVIYTSLGPIFQSAKTTVQIARVEFDPSDLDGDKCDIVPSNVKILTEEDTGNNAFPSCSPDGKSLVFRSGRTGHKLLYIIDAVDGEFNGGVRKLTEGQCIDTMPSWSPKGDLIAFSSNRHNPDDDAVFGIYVIKPDGTGLRRIHVAGADVERERINHVCFSKDGEWLLFTANLGGVTAEPVSLPNQFQPYGDLHVVRLDGSELRRLTWNGYENGTPAWHSGDDDLDLAASAAGVGDELKGRFEEPLWISCDF